MRERLIAAFVAITLLLLALAFVLRSYALDADLRAAEGSDVAVLTRALSESVSRTLDDGGEVATEVLEPFVTDHSRIDFTPADGETVTVTGEGFDPHHAVSGTALTPGGSELTVSHDYGGGPLLLFQSAGSTLALFALMAAIAGVGGHLVARSLAQPFRRLARQAGMLGRGRFDLDLPETGIPEARAIADSLRSSAGQLRDRLERDLEFGMRASHELRTPLTSLRFQLEEIASDPGLSDDARHAADACLKSVGDLNRIAGELVEMSGRGVLLEGAAVPLHSLATQVAQRWAEVLATQGRRVSAAVDGDIDLIFTPGPVEQVLDTVLAGVAAHERGDCRLQFAGAANILRIDLFCLDVDGVGRAPQEVVVGRLTDGLAALGGRSERSAERLRIHLPRR